MTSTLSPSSSDQPLLTVVIPTYNEKSRIAGSLERITQFLDGRPYQSEVLLVDDGSTDGTPDMAAGYSNKRVPIQVIRGDHRGKAYTVRKGMLAAAGKYVLFSDADLSTPIDEIEGFLPYFEQGYDVVIGSREAPGASRFNEPRFRHLMGRVFTRLVQVVTGQRFEDTQCGFKAFTKAAAQSVFSSVRLYGPDSPVIQHSKVTGFDVELLFIARKRGLRIREVPVRWYYAPGSKVDPLRDSFQNLVDVLKVRLYDIRGQYQD